MEQKPASQQIDDIVTMYQPWKNKILSDIRSVVLSTEPTIVEEVKWRMKARPEGLPVWSYNGIVCLVETFKNDIKLVFYKGAFLKDTGKLFNARLQSAETRGIEYKEGDTVQVSELSAMVTEAVSYNKDRKK